MRILVAVLGSLGDIHPMLAVALELRKRGHVVTVATHEPHRSVVEPTGLSFRALRLPGEASDPAFDPLWGDHASFDEGYKRLCVAAIPQLFEKLGADAREADLLLASELVFPARMVAAHAGIPWVSCLLAPYAVSAWPDDPSIDHGTSARGVQAIKEATRVLVALCRDNGLAREVLFARPALIIGLFSSRLLHRPSPHQENTAVVGFPRYEAGRLPDALASFLRRGEPPIVFTLGTLAADIRSNSHLYDATIASARALGHRLVIIAKQDERRQHLRRLAEGDVFVAEYADYAALFPRARLVIHQGGIGTVGLALRAGLPMLIVPFVADQHSNALAARDLGVARTIAVEDYSAERVVAELKALMGDASYLSKAREVAACMREENGAVAACDLLERIETQAT
jgi:UDP:flavonoid glycosyltransferase YjiC (YdhE family)